ncbi:MAG: dienelactone hydrolase family protein [Magnetospirillum sp.]|nr:dienelactone hydrolase family protein [Magnetospirillum sp.]
MAQPKAAGIVVVRLHPQQVLGRRAEGKDVGGRTLSRTARALYLLGLSVVYPDAPHAFHADYRPSWREVPAKDGWQRLQAWFRANGLG